MPTASEIELYKSLPSKTIEEIFVSHAFYKTRPEDLATKYGLPLTIINMILRPLLKGKKK